MYFVPFLRARMRRSCRRERHRSFFPRSYKAVGTPYNEKSDVCIGCGACVYVCPTGHIEWRQLKTRERSGDELFKMQTCDTCGRLFRARGSTEIYQQKDRRVLERFCRFAWMPVKIFPSSLKAGRTTAVNSRNIAPATNT